MTNPTGAQPRFGTDFLFNWLSTPADDPAVALERQLALTVLQRGTQTVDVKAFGYSRTDWQLEHQGISATLTFQNFAQREGSDPRQFVAYSLNIISPATDKSKPAAGLLRAAHEQTFKYGTHVPRGTGDVVELASPDILAQLDSKLPKPLVVHAQQTLAAA